MQECGYRSQFVSQPNRVHDSHPIGGVRAKPSFSASTELTTNKVKAKTCILIDPIFNPRVFEKFLG
jgi:hypothetical protein